MSSPEKKAKIINDPVHGFIKIPFESTFELVEHPYFQRLRRIKQLGLTEYVYPGAGHTRFQHALGAVHLMVSAIETLRNKGHEITTEEAEASVNAILLHDIGHGPFSHALEMSIIEGTSHEKLSLSFMNALDLESGGQLALAIRIFRNRYHKRFLHELVSSQLDVDRMDYLKRDSFFTGVTEGVIGSDRIIKMLNVIDDRLVVDSKGIYSIEKFLIARRLMYWQVYLHKAVLATELMLAKILQRAKYLCHSGAEVGATEDLGYFLSRNSQDPMLAGNFSLSDLEHFARLDDSDIISSAKMWVMHGDRVLSILCKNLLNRKLFRLIISKLPFPREYINSIVARVKDQYSFDEQEAGFFVTSDVISNNAYSARDENIKILYHGGILKDIADASDMLDLSGLSKLVKKYYLCHPKDLEVEDLDLKS